MKALQFIFGLLCGAGLFGNMLLVLYVEWTAMRQGILQSLHPLFHVDVLLTVVSLPLFWGLLRVAAVGFFAMVGAQQFADKSAEARPW